MAYKCVKIWAVLVAVFHVANSVTDGFFEEPTDVEVDAGDTVTLSCSVDSRPTSVLYVYWYKSYGFSDIPSMPISSGRQMNSNVDRRYSVVGSGHEYHLRIENVDVSDTSYYMCKYYTGNYFDSQVARLEVFDEALVPQCRYRPTNGEIGSAVTISCIPGSSATRPTLTLWRGANGFQITNVGRQSDGTITYRFLLKANDNLRSYTCSNGRTYRDIHNCSVTPLTIASTITMSPSFNTGYIGSYARFSCMASGVPEFTTYRWFVGNGASATRITASTGRYIYSTNGNSARLTVYQLRTSDNNTAVRCIALNDVGHRQVAFGKIIVYPPPPVTSSTPRADAVTTRTPSVTNTAVTPVFPSTERRSTTGDHLLPTGYVSRRSTEMTGNEDFTVLEGSVNGPPKSAVTVLLPVLLSLISLLIVIIIILVILIKKTGRPYPKFLKRLWLCKLKPPDGLRGMSFTRPGFLEGAIIQRRLRGARRRLHDWQNTLVTRINRSNAQERDEKRQSIRDHPIEVLVNPPPPDWKFKVEDVTKLKRQRLISTHAPTGGYSDKEMDLLNSLITGNVTMTTLDRVKGVDIARTGRDYEGSKEAMESPQEVRAQPSPEQEDVAKETAVPQSQSDETKVAAIVVNGVNEDRAKCDDGARETPHREKVIYDNTNYDKKEKVKQFEDNAKASCREDVLYDNTKFDGNREDRMEKDVVDGQTQSNEEVIYDNTQFDKGIETGPECPENEDILDVNYAELDLKITGPWDEGTVIQTEPKTTYAIIDHTKINPVVETRCK